MSAPHAPACLLAACGLPGAGKSTHCAALAAHLCTQGDVACVCVSYDDVERRLAGAEAGDAPFDAARWKRARAEALACVDAHLASASSSHAPLLVIADDNAHLTSMRHELFQLARARGAAYVQLYIRAPAELAEARNAARPTRERVPSDAFSRMAAAFEAPNASQRVFERDTLVVDAADAVDATALWNRVWDAWAAPPPPPPSQAELDARRAEGAAANAASALHAWDVAARRAVSDAMATAPPHAKAGLAAALNACRREQLAALQRGEALCGEGGGGGGEGAEAEAVAALRRQLAELWAQLRAPS